MHSLDCLRSFVLHGTRSQATEEEYLSYFDSLVQQQELTGRVLSGIQGSLLPFKYVLYMVTSANLPFASDYMSKIAAGPGERLAEHLVGFDIMIWSMRIFFDWLNFFLVILLAVQLSMLVWKGACWRYFSRRCLAFLLVPPTLAFAMTWEPYRSTMSRTPPNSLLPLIPFTALLFINLVFFVPLKWVTSCSRLETHPHKTPARLAMPAEHEGEDSHGVPVEAASSHDLISL